MVEAVQPTISNRKDELSVTILAGAYFFCILCAYFILRPVREAMGLKGGADELSWLFMGTLIVTLLVNPLYGMLVSRFPRHVFIPVTYRFFMINLLGFFLLLQFAPQHVGDVVGRVFFVWLSVFNLFAVAVFWSFMADGFTLEQSKRLFGLIGLGGTVGAIAGAALTTSLVQHLGAPAMMLLSIVMLEAAVGCVYALHRRFEQMRAAPWVGVVDALPSGVGRTVLSDATNQLPVVVGHASAPTDANPDLGAINGIVRVLQSPYLLAVCGYVFLLAIMTTFFYFAQARIVSAFALGTNERAAILGRIELYSQLLTLVAQFLLARPMIRYLGVGLTLAVMSVLSASGLALLSLMPTVPALMVFQVLFSAGRHGLTRPARETLFTVLSREDKYKAKGFIDTFVFRAGDVVGALGDKCIHALQFGLTGVAVIALPLAVAWAVVSVYLGGAQKALKRRP